MRCQKGANKDFQFTLPLSTEPRKRHKYPTWLFGLLHVWQNFLHHFLSTAYKCNWHSVKVLHKEGKGGQVSIQPFTAEGNSLCHIHLHLHTYQAGRNLKLTNISIEFVQVMVQISYLSWASENSQQFTENVFFFNSFLMSLQKHNSWFCQIPTHFYSELIRPIHFANACYLEMSPN